MVRCGILREATGLIRQETYGASGAAMPVMFALSACPTPILTPSDAGHVAVAPGAPTFRIR